MGERDKQLGYGQPEPKQPVTRSSSRASGLRRPVHSIRRQFQDFKNRRLTAAIDSVAVAAGRLLAARARHLLLVPSRREPPFSTPPLVSGAHSFDAAADLAEFTGLPRQTVDALLARRIENFRTEWLESPPELLPDDWFYLSSRLYLFANAGHFHDTPAIVDEIVSQLRPAARVLDFGGGTGNLSLALAAHGLEVDYRELSALQKDFTRFRLKRYGLADRVRVLDSWESLAAARYDAVCAFDVLEHVPDLPHVVEELASSLAAGGILLDTPSFGATLLNPMHHDDPGLERLLAEQGLVLERTLPDFRVWAKATQP